MRRAGRAFSSVVRYCCDDSGHHLNASRDLQVPSMAVVSGFAGPDAKTVDSRSSVGTYGLLGGCTCRRFIPAL